MKLNRKIEVPCDHCSGTGKRELCRLCEGGKYDRNEAEGHCDACKTPVCYHHSSLGEDCTLCVRCYPEGKL